MYKPLFYVSKCILLYMVFGGGAHLSTHLQVGVTTFYHATFRHFLQLHYIFRGKYCTFYSSALIWEHWWTPTVSPWARKCPRWCPSSGRNMVKCPLFTTNISRLAVCWSPLTFMWCPFYLFRPGAPQASWVRHCRRALNLSTLVNEELIPTNIPT